MSDRGTFVLESHVPRPSDRQWVHFIVSGGGAASTSAVPVRAEVGTAELVIGRTSTADVRVADPCVSSRHCSVKRVDTHVVVQDLGSTNGTFVAGIRITEPTPLPVGASFQVGDSVFLHECRDREELQQLEQIRDLEKAAQYVASLLPQPIARDGWAAQWCYQPSALLGGDSFGYHELDPQRVAVYVLDVSGHGVAAALHSVSVTQMLSKETLRDAVFAEPASVLDALSRLLPAEQHDGRYFTIWYGVLDRRRRTLSYASAGHPPALCFTPGGAPHQLATRKPPIGLWPDIVYEAGEVEFGPGSQLFVFTDGCYEDARPDGTQGCYAEFAARLVGLVGEGRSTPRDVIDSIRADTGVTEFGDDVCLLRLTSTEG